MISYYGVSKEGEIVLLNKEEVPLKRGDVRVKVKALAINPIDAKSLHWGLRGVGIGFDFSGSVIAIGEGVSTLNVGDEVAGWISALSPEDPTAAGFATQVDLAEDALLRFTGLQQSTNSTTVPAPISTFEQAASLPMGLTTAALGYVLQFKLPLTKGSQNGVVLVNAASSSVGFNAAQLGKWLGFDVIAVTSEKHFGMLRAAGIEHLLDYHDDQWPEKARELGDIGYVIDPISTADTTNNLMRAIPDQLPVKIAQFDFVDYSSLTIKQSVDIAMVSDYLWYEVEKTFIGLPTFKGDPEILENRLKYFLSLSEFCETALALPITLAGTALTDIPKGIDAVLKASGEKFVVSIL